jgi:hypothetical protein
VVKGARGIFPLKLSPSSNFPLSGKKKMILLHNIHPCLILRKLIFIQKWLERSGPITRKCHSALSTMLLIFEFHNYRENYFTTGQ